MLLISFPPLTNVLSFSFRDLFSLFFWFQRLIKKVRKVELDHRNAALRKSSFSLLLTVLVPPLLLSLCLSLSLSLFLRLCSSIMFLPTIIWPQRQKCKTAKMIIKPRLSATRDSARHERGCHIPDVARRRA